MEQLHLPALAGFDLQRKIDAQIAQRTVGPTRPHRAHFADLLTTRDQHGHDLQTALRQGNDDVGDGAPDLFGGVEDLDPREGQRLLCRQSRTQDRQ